MTREEGKTASRTPEEAGMLVPATPSLATAKCLVASGFSFMASSFQSPPGSTALPAVLHKRGVLVVKPEVKRRGNIQDMFDYLPFPQNCPCS